MLPSTGDLMVVKLEAGGYWAEATATRKEINRERKEEYMVVQSCFNHQNRGEQGEEEKRKAVHQLQSLEECGEVKRLLGFIRLWKAAPLINVSDVVQRFSNTKICRIECRFNVGSGGALAL